MAPLRLLVTGFGRFPGAPSNPSGPLARALARSRRLATLSVAAMVLPTEWEAAARFPDALERLAPDMVLMIGLAGRRRHVCVERLGRNAGGAFPDAARRRPATRLVERHAPPFRSCAADPVDLLHGLHAAGVPARLSRDAGRYICNALAFRAYGWAARAVPPRRVIFVHIPYPDGGRLSSAVLLRGLEALALRLAAQQRRAALMAAFRR